MLPYIEQDNLYNFIASGPQEGGMTQNRPFGPHSLRPYSAYKQKISTFLCPSDPGAQTMGWSSAQAPIDYAMNVGDSTRGRDGWSIVDTRDSRGMFNRAFNAPGSTHFSGRGKALGQVTDGTSNTLMFSEITIFNGQGKLHGHYVVIPASTFRAGPIICMQAKGPNGTLVGTLPSSHHRHGEAWASGYPMICGFTAILPPNAPSCANERGEWQEGIYSANSYHTGGVNAVMVDGSVHFITENIDTGNLALPVPVSGPSPYGVWGALGSSAENEVAQLP